MKILDEKGSILLLSVSTFIFMSALISTLFLRSFAENNNTVIQAEINSAFNYAEAGIADAIAVLRQSSFEWDDELKGLDGIAGTTDDGYLGFGSLVSMGNGSYSVRVYDNNDESPGPNDPTDDIDGIIHVHSIGQDNRATSHIEVYIKVLVDLAIAAEQDIELHESSALGNIHANGNIEVWATSDLTGNSEATAAGNFIFGPGETLNISSGDLVGGDDPIDLPWPDAAALEASVTRWNPPDHNDVITLQNNDVAGYRIGSAISPNTISPMGPATIVVFDGDTMTFREKIGVFDGSGNCSTFYRVNLIAIGGGSINLDETACIEGLIWAEGDINIGEKSSIRGAIISANGSVDVAEESNIVFDRSVLDEALLSGFWGVNVKSWREVN